MVFSFGNLTFLHSQLIAAMQKNKIVLIVTIIISFYTGLHAQEIVKVWFNKSDSVYGYYNVVRPLSGRIQGALILLDGFSGNASGFLTETKIHNVACANDLLTVCIPTGFRLWLDSSMITLLNTTLLDIIKTYKVKKDQFAFGGFSSGGTILLRYAELCKEKPAEYPVTPKAIFTGDSPVDIIGLYKSAKRELQKGFQGWWLGESQMIIDKLEENFGKPEQNLTKYSRISPFYVGDTTVGNERFLRDVPYRTYHDVDIAWHLQNRKRSLYETNMLNASELVSRLQLLGNKRAEFVSSKLPGKRIDGSRHPHSWSIIDEIDLVQWVKDALEFYPDHIASPYQYNAPQGWNPETILFPIDFAPSLPYTGFEELRFAPGWGDSASAEKWAYTILWWLNDAYHFDEKILEENLESYFSGLTRRRAVADNLDLSLVTPAKAKVTKSKNLNNDGATYSATVNIFDAQVTRKPSVLYIKIHQKNCPAPSKTLLLFEICASPYNLPVWKSLDKIDADFRCKK